MASDNDHFAFVISLAIKSIRVKNPNKGSQMDCFVY